MTVLLQSSAFVYLIVVQWSICVGFVLLAPAGVFLKNKLFPKPYSGTFHPAQLLLLV